MSLLRRILSGPLFNRWAICAGLAVAALSVSCAGEAGCGDNVVDPGEQCDDGNANDLDGCTSACRSGAVCDAAVRPGGDAFSVDAMSGRCYARYDGETITFDAASTACAVQHGHLVSITDAGEQTIVGSLAPSGDLYWIGAIDDANTTDAVFTWLTGEAWAYSAFAPGEPDDDAGLGGGADCLAFASDGWKDTVCTSTGYVTGRLCEFEPSIFLDGFES